MKFEETQREKEHQDVKVGLVDLKKYCNFELKIPPFSLIACTTVLLTGYSLIVDTLYFV
jgi:hypothetical protein